MKVFDLQCALGHGFEGWFASGEDFESQYARGLVECPFCGDRAVVKLLSAPRLNIGAQGQSPALPSTASPQGRWMQAVRQLMAETEFVGERFADEARRIHYGEVPERNIRGNATREQAAELLEEGIAVMSLALPDALKETLQ